MYYRGGCKLNCSVSAFGTEPYLIRMGRNCLIGGDVQLITHDGGAEVLKNMGYFDGKRMDKIAPIRLGDNVYLGMGAYVMPGVTIGDNVIIGAKALVTKDIPSNTVAVGIPAKPIMDIQTYYAQALERNVFYPTWGMSGEEKRAYFEKNLRGKQMWED